MKKTGYIIYQPSEEQKNRKFVELFQRSGRQWGLEFVSGTIENYRSFPRPDFVLNRTRDYRVSEYYEGQGTAVFHRTELVRMGNDKAEALDVLRQHWDGMGAPPIPESIVLMPEDSREESAFREKINAWQEENNLQDTPLIFKTVDGHGGREVFLWDRKNRTEREKTDHAIWTVLAGRKLLCQEMIDCDNRDIRVYIVGGEIYSAVLRQGKGDFRSNYSLGGTVREYILSPKEREEVQECIRCFGGKDLAMAGTDFLIDRQGRLVFNEVEEMVGSRMLYACTDKDIVQDYVAWLAQIL